MCTIQVYHGELNSHVPNNEVYIQQPCILIKEKLNCIHVRMSPINSLLFSYTN